MATQSSKPVSASRQRMIDDMRLRKLGPKTQTQYVRAVEKFTKFFRRSPDLATAEDLRRFQLHMIDEGVSAITINTTITGLRFLFDLTLDRPEVMKKMSRIYEPKKIPVVLSVDEVSRLLQSAGCLKYQAALGVAYGAGLRASEVCHPTTSDIDSKRMVPWRRARQRPTGPLYLVVAGAARIAIWVIDRQSVGAEALQEKGVELISLFTMEDIENHCCPTVSGPLPA